MAAHIRSVTINALSRLNRYIYIAQNANSHKVATCLNQFQVASIHLSRPTCDLMEFFEDPKNWGKDEVKSGRSWTEDDLRIKSNLDLQKLWYVLLKERNMLMTMEHHCKEECEVFPSPERLYKVQDSMKCLEKVVHERNDAYWQLEIGESAPKPKEVPQLDPKDPLAILNQAIEAAGFNNVTDRQTLKFQYLLKEKRNRLLKRQKSSQEQEAMYLLKRFPNLDVEALKEKYPDIDLPKLLKHKKTLGHHEFNTA
nr:EOG090X0DBE [Sida crystallina]